MRIATIGSVAVDVREFLSMVGNSPSERLIWLPFAVGVNPHRTAGFHVQPMSWLIQFLVLSRSPDHERSLTFGLQLIFYDLQIFSLD